MDLNSQTFVSIVIPTYNQGPYIGDCLDSILNQTYKNIEIIIQDNFSTDETNLICKQYSAKHSQIRYYQENDKGQSDALNIGLHKSNGVLWTWICSDDRYNNNTAIEQLVQAISPHLSNVKNNIVGCYGDAIYITETGLKIDTYPSLRKDLSVIDFKLNWPLAQPASLLLKSEVLKAGAVNGSLKFGMDLDLFIRMLKGNNRFIYVPHMIADVRNQENSKSVKFQLDTAINALIIVETYFIDVGPLGESAYGRELKCSLSDKIFPMVGFYYEFKKQRTFLQKLYFAYIVFKLIFRKAPAI